MKAGIFEDFEYLEKMDRQEIATFQKIIKAFLFNMEVRFPCPSFSIAKRVARRHVDPTTEQLDLHFLENVSLNCQINEFVGIHLFPDDLIKKNTINPLFLSGKYPEIPLMASEIVSNRELFMHHNMETADQMTKNTGSDSTITLQDVFKMVKKETYPFLWGVTLRMIAIMPTSASCEQSFSCLKHRLHENIKKRLRSICC